MEGWRGWGEDGGGGTGGRLRRVRYVTSSHVSSEEGRRKHAAGEWHRQVEQNVIRLHLFGALSEW